MSDLPVADRPQPSSRQRRPWGEWSLFILITLLITLIFAATTKESSIMAIRNTWAYQLMKWRAVPTSTLQPAPSGELYGCIRDAQRQPIAGAQVLLSEHTGVIHQATADTSGCYRVAAPAGLYVPVASAPGYDDALIRPWGMPLRLDAGSQYQLDVTLAAVSLSALEPGANLRLGEPLTRTWPLPQPAMAVRRTISYTSGGRPNQATFLYTPSSASVGAAPWPTLLAVYPGPADQWEGVSIELAAAGYAIVAVGPAYALDLENDIADLQRLLAFVRAGHLPGVDGRRVIVLGGSYSSLHVLSLLQRDVGLRGAVLLGPVSDMFDLRRRFEQGSFFPPFGLDQALIALGTPNTAPDPYWRYSARYHLRPDLPPILLMHSRSDAVVPFQQSEQFVADLERIGVDFEPHFFDGMSHYLYADQPSPDLTKLYEITLDFLRRRMAQ